LAGITPELYGLYALEKAVLNAGVCYTG
jgi:hypothetical protein